MAYNIKHKEVVFSAPCSITCWFSTNSEALLYPIRWGSIQHIEALLRQMSHSSRAAFQRACIVNGVWWLEIAILRKHPAISMQFISGEHAGQSILRIPCRPTTSTVTAELYEHNEVEHYHPLEWTLLLRQRWLAHALCARAHFPAHVHNARAEHSKHSKEGMEGREV